MLLYTVLRKVDTPRLVGFVLTSNSEGNLCFETLEEIIEEKNEEGKKQPISYCSHLSLLISTLPFKSY